MEISKGQLVKSWVQKHYDEMAKDIQTRNVTNFEAVTLMGSYLAGFMGVLLEQTVAEEGWEGVQMEICAKSRIFAEELKAAEHREAQSKNE